MVCRMFAEESEQIINRMNAMDPLVREPVLRAIDRYHYAMNRNNLAVMQI